MSKAIAQAPIAVFASRSMDIPALYSGWFFHRMEVEYSAWTNPFNGAGSYVSYTRTHFIVFWPKDPRPLLTHLDELEERGIGYYVRYSLNDYERRGLEQGVSPIAKRIRTFKLSVERPGFGGVVWRFDPFMLTDGIDIDKLLTKMGYIGDQLKGCAEELVSSFADITLHRKVRSNLLASSIPCCRWTEEQMVEFCERLVAPDKLKGWNYALATHGEKGRYKGVELNHCMDDVLMIRKACGDKELIESLKAEVRLIPVSDLSGTVVPLPSDVTVLDNGHYVIRGNDCDRGQREFCGCTKSKNMGQYNTCVHPCEYCYANSSKQSTARSYKCHKKNPWGETITRI